MIFQFNFPPILPNPIDTGPNDFLVGTRYSETFYGGSGADYIDGNDGSDTIFGGTGDDTLFGGKPDVYSYEYDYDYISGGAGDDTIHVFGSGEYYGGADDDIFILRPKSQTINTRIDGGEGSDWIHVNRSVEFVDLSGGSVSSDTSNDEHFEGVRLKDIENIRVLDGWTAELLGNNSDNIIDGSGSRLSVTIEGRGGDDTLIGTIDYDEIIGGAGNDIIYGGAGPDDLRGGSDDDTIYGGRSFDDLEGGSGKDSLIGGDGDDRLRGGNDQDNLEGGSGSDELWGNGGRDVFVFRSARHSDMWNTDTINDFERPGVAPGDIIDLRDIDADTARLGNQSFQFYGERTTTEGLALGRGALWTENNGSDTLIYGNVDSDSRIELVIRVADGATYDAEDYHIYDFML